MKVVKRRRASLIVPGSAADKIEKARSIEVDEIVIDLEDAVVAGAKEEARARAVEAISTGNWLAEGISIRVNGIGTEWHDGDLAALADCHGRLASVVLPKVESPSTVAAVDCALSGHDDRGEIGLQLLIENATGLLSVSEIAAASDRVRSLIIGYADLAASLGRRKGFDHSGWATARELVLVAARSNDLQAIDGPHLGIKVDADLKAGVEEARRSGFDGKWAIHPAQLATLTTAFTPDEDEVRHAREVLDQLARAEAEAGQGAVALDGQMLDEAVRLSALRILAAVGEPS
ncbi:MAG: CoA ester lyase [Actinobacteria bacterium]|nr:CoA ester lyase [Actinomycetota bacterium]